MNKLVRRLFVKRRFEQIACEFIARIGKHDRFGRIESRYTSSYIVQTRQRIPKRHLARLFTQNNELIHESKRSLLLLGFFFVAEAYCARKLANSLKQHNRVCFGTRSRIF